MNFDFRVWDGDKYHIAGISASGSIFYPNDLTGWNEDGSVYFNKIVDWQLSSRMPDKNNKILYDWDIVKCEGFCFGHYLVRFRDGKFSLLEFLGCKDGDFVDYGWRPIGRRALMDNIEIVGNPFEDLSLLELLVDRFPSMDKKNVYSHFLFDKPMAIGRKNDIEAANE